jgi:thiol-disulfide isomerase/thioredoxin
MTTPGARDAPATEVGARPPAPVADGEALLVVVKQDCPTCRIVAPVLPELAAATTVEVLVQDDAGFLPPGLDVRLDHDLSVSYGLDLEAVPTLLRFVDGVEHDRLVGWDRERWAEVTGVADLGAALPDHRPGCASRHLDPAERRRLDDRFGAARLASSTVTVPPDADVGEVGYDRDWSDGLPVVAPTPSRVLAMLEGTSRDAAEVLGELAPGFVPCTVEKVAVNAVLAGCLPDHLPVVLAAVEAVCDPRFNLHGVLCTLMGVAPVIVVNGPVRRATGMNAGLNVLGQGNRANATIGRAVQLTVRNVGGGRPGGIDRSCLGQPGKLGLCFAEAEEGSAWESLAVARGMDPATSAVTVFAGEAPRTVMDMRSRTPESLATSLAEGLRGAVSRRAVLRFDATLVVSPEHHEVFRRAGWSRDDLLAALHERLLLPTDEVLRGANGCEDGMPRAEPGSPVPDWHPELGISPALPPGAMVPKFRDGGILLVRAGGEAGPVSAVVGGWLNGHSGSEPVTREVAR